MPGIEDVRRFLSGRGDLVQGQGASQSDIDEIARDWGSALPNDYEVFLKEFGWVEFDIFEVPGAGPSVPDHLSVLALAHDSWNGGLPRELLPVFDSYGDWLYCISRHHKGRVVLWSHELGEDQPYDEQYDSWSDWFLSHLS